MRPTALIAWREVAPMLATFAALAGCSAETTPRWDLVHDRMIAVRASAPGLAPGAVATVDVLITSETGGAAEVAPMLVAVAPATPASLAGAVATSGGAWTVTAPEAGAIDAARVALGLSGDAPVPLGLVITVAIDSQVFVATKTVWLGADAANPAIAEVRVNGTVAGATAAAPVGELELAIDATDDDEIAWLTSIGELDDIDDAVAHLQVDEPADGQLVVVRRDDHGGVAWRIVGLRVE